jgi:hypothetical protein
MDHLDRASTLNFTCIARVRGVLTDRALTRGLRLLEAKHPLLRARIARRWGLPRFVLGEAAPIPLRVEIGSEEDWRPLAEASLMHREWPDQGPRAELIWLRHTDDQSTLIFCLQHVVGDGLSAMIALRDLLFLAGAPVNEVEPIPSPGVGAFLPSWSHNLRQLVRALVLQFAYFLKPWPRRLRAVWFASMRRRRVHLDSLLLRSDVSARLTARAKREGTSVHGVLCAAVAQATSRELGGCAQQRILHPVDLRRHLIDLGSDAPEIGDAVGCYAAAIQTDHRVDADRPLATIASEITHSVRRHKAASEPLLVASHLGPSLVRVTRFMDRLSFRAIAEALIFRGTFSLSNLGSLDNTALAGRIGELEVEGLSIISAGSVMHSMTLTALTFRGALDLQLCSVEPFVPRSTVARVLADTERRLTAYALQTECSAEVSAPAQRLAVQHSNGD